MSLDGPCFYFALFLRLILVRSISRHPWDYLHARRAVAPPRTAAGSCLENVRVITLPGYINACSLSVSYAAVAPRRPARFLAEHAQGWGTYGSRFASEMMRGREAERLEVEFSVTSGPRA